MSFFVWNRFFRCFFFANEKKTALSENSYVEFHRNERRAAKNDKIFFVQLLFKQTVRNTLESSVLCT